MATIRVAMVGGTDALRAAKRSALEATQGIQVIFDSDAFEIAPEQLLDVNFDVAIVEQRLSQQTAFELIKATHSLARISSGEPGLFLISAQFDETQLRVSAVEAGAVDCVFVSEGLDSLTQKVLRCADPLTDFAIREMLPALEDLPMISERFQSTQVSLDTLDANEAKVLEGFCRLKKDADIATHAQVSVAKVRASLLKIQRLLLLDTRSQLLLRMYQLGALTL